MLRKILPFALVAIAISTVFAVLFMTQRMGMPHPNLDKLTKRFLEEPALPDPESEGL